MTKPNKNELVEIKYCPMCLNKCEIRTDKLFSEREFYYSCDACKIIAFSDSVLLNYPDVMASRKFLLSEYLKRNHAGDE